LLRRSSSQPGPLGAKHPCLSRMTGARPLFGLAPGGVCHASAVASAPVRSYRTLSPLPVHPTLERNGKPSAVCFLWHFPLMRARKHAPGGRYPPPLFRGARTFLVHKDTRLPSPLMSRVDIGRSYRTATCLTGESVEGSFAGAESHINSARTACAPLKVAVF
jgi:hypothetical protein